MVCVTGQRTIVMVCATEQRTTVMVCVTGQRTTKLWFFCKIVENNSHSLCDTAQNNKVMAYVTLQDKQSWFV